MSKFRVPVWVKFVVMVEVEAPNVQVAMDRAKMALAKEGLQLQGAEAVPPRAELQTVRRFVEEVD